MLIGVSDDYEEIDRMFTTIIETVNQKKSHLKDLQGLIVLLGEEYGVFDFNDPSTYANSNPNSKSSSSINSSSSKSNSNNNNNNSNNSYSSSSSSSNLNAKSNTSFKSTTSTLSNDSSVSNYNSSVNLNGSDNKVSHVTSLQEQQVRATNRLTSESTGSIIIQDWHYFKNREEKEKFNIKDKLLEDENYVKTRPRGDLGMCVYVYMYVYVCFCVNVFVLMFMLMFMLMFTLYKRKKSLI